MTASLNDGPVRASRQTVVVPDTTLDDALSGEYDMVVLPGGLPGADHLAADARINELLRSMARDGRYTAAICAAPKVLLGAGLLEGKRATAFPGVLDDATGVTTDDAIVVKDGRIVTSRGPGTAMDFALALIGELCGQQCRDEVEAQLQRPSHHLQ